MAPKQMSPIPFLDLKESPTDKFFKTHFEKTLVRSQNHQKPEKGGRISFAPPQTPKAIRQRTDTSVSTHRRAIRCRAVAKFTPFLGGPRLNKGVCKWGNKKSLSSLCVRVCFRCVGSILETYFGMYSQYEVFFSGK